MDKFEGVYTRCDDTKEFNSRLCDRLFQAMVLEEFLTEESKVQFGDLTCCPVLTRSIFFVTV